MKTQTRGESPLSATFCSPFFIFGEGKYRVAIHIDRITMIHDEGDATLLKLDMGSGNYETIRRIEMPFDAVMQVLANVRALSRERMRCDLNAIEVLMAR